MMRGAIGHIADNERQAEYLWLLNYIKRSGSRGRTNRDVAKATRGKFDVKRTDAITQQLRNAGEVVYGTLELSSGQTTLRFRPRKDAPHGVKSVW
jgi:hypothetical protein